jgi:hypothetical protein
MREDEGGDEVMPPVWRKRILMFLDRLGGAGGFLVSIPIVCPSVDFWFIPVNGFLTASESD